MMVPDAPPTEGFALHVHYLTGYAVAATPGGSAEWPPHPARLFMALVAACYETGGDAEQIAALRWLETLDPPTVIASRHDERPPVEAYVPPNDAKSPGNADKIADEKIFGSLLVLPQYRTDRQPRTFPRVRPHVPVVTFKWSTPPQHAEALAAVCDNVTRLGHSSSLVQVWLDTDVAVAGDEKLRQFMPDENGRTRLRTVNPGALDDLDARYRRDDVEAHFELHAAASVKGKGQKQAKADYERRLGRRWSANVDPPERMRPEMKRSTAYRADGEVPPVAGTHFDPQLLIVTLNPIDTSYRRLSAANGVETCALMRKAILSHAGDDAPEVLTGHNAHGDAARQTHMAIFPLPDVSGPYPHGHLLGLAIALPAELDAEDRRGAVAAINHTRELTLGKLGTWKVSATQFGEHRAGLTAATWTGIDNGSRCWATVTPIALDRHAKSKDPVEQQDEIAAMIRKACGDIGLPDPSRVVPFPASPLRSAPTAYDYPRLQRKDGSKRRQTHAMLWFKEPIVGPVLLGAGRYRGWGVCRPYHERSAR